MTKKSVMKAECKRATTPQTLLSTASSDNLPTRLPALLHVVPSGLSQEATVSYQPFYAPNRSLAAPRQRKPGEHLFEFRRGHDRILCELRDQGEFGIEAQFFENEDLLFSRRFETRMGAVQWAEKERKAIVTGGA